MLLLASAKVLLPGFDPNGAISLCALVAMNISLLWSENELQLLHLQVEFTK